MEEREYVPLEALETKKMLPQQHYSWREAQSSLVTFEKDDILFGAMRPYQHKVAVAPCAGVSRSTVFVIRPKRANLHAYVFLTLFQGSSVEYATMICNGSDRPYAVWNRGFERMPLWVPEDPLLNRLETIVGPILDAMVPLQLQVDALMRVRDTLRPRLISGNLKVDHLDIRLPPSMRAEAEAAGAMA